MRVDTTGFGPLDAPAHRDFLDTGGPGLVHGDFRPENLLVDAEGRLTAVIDWEAAKSGPHEQAPSPLHGVIRGAKPARTSASVAVTYTCDGGPKSVM